MLPETVEQLKSKYPHILSKIIFIECGEGWYNLINRLCASLESHLTTIPEEIVGGVYAVQIKEKFGGLRFYMNESTPFIDGAIALAESMSLSICERCGNVGEQRPGGWVKTLCNTHYKEQQKRQKETAKQGAKHTKLKAAVLKKKFGPVVGKQLADLLIKKA